MLRTISESWLMKDLPASRTKLHAEPREGADKRSIIAAATPVARVCEWRQRARGVEGGKAHS